MNKTAIAVSSLSLWILGATAAGLVRAEGVDALFTDLEKVQSEVKMCGKPQDCASVNPNAAPSASAKRPAPALTKSFPPSRSPLFQSSEPLDLEVQGPFPVVPDGKTAGTIGYQNRFGKSVSMAANFESRGAWRRNVCGTFPAFKIELPKGGRKGTLFAGLDRDLKVVSPCSLPQTAEDLNAIKIEYTMYRFIQASGLPTLATRWVNFHVKDASGKYLGVAQGFVVENVKDAAERFGVLPGPKKAWRASRTLGDPNATMELLEGMVANQDFSMDGTHNTRIVKGPKQSVHFPYDFDLAGLRLELDGVNPIFNYWIEKHKAWSFRPHYAALVEKYGDAIRPALARALANEKAMAAVIDSSFLTDAQKAKFREFLARYVRAALQHVKPEAGPPRYRERF